MCLYPKLITNPKYTKTKKNGGNIPYIEDIRVIKVPIGCQKCMECRKQKANHWKVRLLEDIKENKNGKFVTFTFSEESLQKIQLNISDKLEGYDIDNAIATWAVRKFTEKWRHKHGKTIRHWLVTELGQTNTERIHLHGIIWTDQPKSEVLSQWEFGNMGWETTWEQENNRVNGSTIGYLVKYVSKTDKKHPNYQSKILTSKGIGSNYINTPQSRQNQFKDENTNDTYRTNKGTKTSLPIYYRNKLYTEKQREQLWLQKLDKETRYVNGERVDVSTQKGEQEYHKLLKWHQERNEQLGYGTDKQNWKQAEYEKELRNLKKQERENQVKKSPPAAPTGGGY